MTDDIDYTIQGESMQLVEVTLDPGETVIAEAGTLCYMDSCIDFNTKLGDGSDADSGFFGKMFSAGKRMMTGESLFMTHFTNDGRSRAQATFAAPFPGTVLPIDLQEFGGKVICQKDAFLAAALGTNISVEFTKRLGAGFFNSEGFILQSLKGRGKAFLHAGGTLVRRDLENETIKADGSALVAFTEGIDYNIEMAKLKSAMLGGEGLFLATMSGTGTVWLQSLPFPRLVDRIHQSLPAPPSSNN